MEYTCKETNKLLGIVLPIPYVMTDILIILDENNRLWYAPQKNTYLSFQLVEFTYDSENKVTTVQAASLGSVGQVKSLSHLKEKKDYYTIPTNEILNDVIDCDYIIEWGWSSLYIIGYLRKDFNRSSGFVFYDYDPIPYDIIDERHYHYIAHDVNIIKKRYFFIDYTHKTYREITSKFVDVIEHVFTNMTNHDFTLPYDWQNVFQGTTCSISDFVKEIKSICDFILDFNPYDIFESFRMRRVFSSKSHIDIFGETWTEKISYDSISMEYHDIYLNKWFPFPTGTEDGAEIYESQENKIKGNAYSEYSIQEHFDSLIRPYFNCLLDRFEKIKSGEIKYKPYTFFPEYFKIKEVYKLFNIRLKDIPRTHLFRLSPMYAENSDSYDDSQLKAFEKELINAIDYFNEYDRLSKTSENNNK